MPFYSYEYLDNNEGLKNNVEWIFIVILSIILLGIMIWWGHKKLLRRYPEFVLLFSVLILLFAGTKIGDELTLRSEEGQSRANVANIELVAEKLLVDKHEVYSSTIDFTEDTIYKVGDAYYRLYHGAGNKADILLEKVEAAYVSPPSYITQ